MTTMKVLLILLLKKCDIILKLNLKVIAKKCEIELINSNKLFMIKQFLNFILNQFIFL